MQEVRIAGDLENKEVSGKKELEKIKNIIKKDEIARKEAWLEGLLLCNQKEPV